MEMRLCDKRSNKLRLSGRSKLKLHRDVDCAYVACSGHFGVGVNYADLRVVTIDNVVDTEVISLDVDIRVGVEFLVTNKRLELSPTHFLVENITKSGGISRALLA